ncbi:MAG: LysE family translocator [Anaerolineae bacterium]|nr:LysE family translocator [Anaerolineae bacterium]
MDPQIISYTLVVALLTLTPGADTLLVIRNVLSGGRLSGFATTLGGNCGLFVHATLSALGLSVILVNSALAYELVKTAGAVYLVYLGIKSFYQAIRRPRPSGDNLNQGQQNTPPKSFRVSFLEGFFTNILNPKVAIFYLAFLPQFIRPQDPVLIKSLGLAGIHAALGIIWLGSLSFVLHRGRSFIQTSAFRRWLEGISGLVLVGLGIRLVFEKR